MEKSQMTAEEYRRSIERRHNRIYVATFWVVLATLIFQIIILVGTSATRSSVKTLKARVEALEKRQ